MSGVAPLLVVGIGNASRGDDALGPALIAELQREEAGGVEFHEAYQLQIEHALDLLGRRAVLYVDASRAPVPGGAALHRLQPARGHPPASHALAPEAVLGVHEQVCATAAPEAWVLAIEGRSFELGQALTPTARQHLVLAGRLARAWLADRREFDGLPP